MRHFDCTVLRCVGMSICKQLKQLADPVRLLEGVSERLFWIDQVVVSSPNSSPANVTRVNEISNYSLCSSFSNANLRCDITPSDTRITTYADQNMAMVGKERPRWLLHLFFH